MPIDLFKENGIEQAPVDLFKKNGIDLKPKTNPSLIPRIGADVLAGLGQFGHGLLNSPANIADALANHGILNKSLANSIPRQPEYNYSQMLGVQNPNIGDKLLQGAIQYSPYALGGEAALGAKLASTGLESAPLAMRLANQAKTGALFGATQEQNPISGAALGAVTAPLGDLALGGIGAGVNHFGQYAAKGASNLIEKILDPIKNLTNEDAFEFAKSNYKSRKSAENQIWNQIPFLSKNIDDQQIPFNNKSYIDSLTEKLKELQGQSERQSAFSRGNKDPESMLEGYLNDEHGNFSNAIEHYKSLNKDYQNEITPGKSLPFNMVNLARKNMKNTIVDNIEKQGLKDTLGQAWNTANKVTEENNRLFHGLTNPKGKENNISSFISYFNNKSPYAERGNFMNDYIPKNSSDGTSRMQQFIDMMGNPNLGKDYLKNGYFSDAIKTNGIDSNLFLNKFNKLSEKQQELLFNPEELNRIQVLNSIVQNHPSALDKEGGQSMLKHLLPVALGGAVGSYAHHPMLGAMLGASVEPSLSSIFSHPRIQDFFMNQAIKNNSIPEDIMKEAIRKGLPATLLPIEEKMNRDRKPLDLTLTTAAGQAA